MLVWKIGACNKYNKTKGWCRLMSNIWGSIVKWQKNGGLLININWK